MMNVGLSLQAAQRMADSNVGDNLLNRSEQIEGIFRRILMRTPNETELVSCQLFLETRTFVELCLVLLNTNEFAFLE